MIEKFSIHPQARLGAVSLTVLNLEGALGFYRPLLGLQLLEHRSGFARLGTTQRDLIELVEDPHASRSARSTGLYHLAILLPSRKAFARVLQRLLVSRYPLQGFANHGVSEAVYLADPEGNGIEIYRDLPRSAWPYQDGRLAMTTALLDLDSIFSELNDQVIEDGKVPEETVIGHVHLRVSDIHQAEQFYTNVIGFDLIQRYGPSAGFVSAGGYHHHVGFNTWESAGASPPSPGSVGLRWFTICLPEQSDLEQITRQLQAAGFLLQKSGTSWLTNDPAGNGIRLVVCQTNRA